MTRSWISSTQKSLRAAAECCWVSSDQKDKLYWLGPKSWENIDPCDLSPSHHNCTILFVTVSIWATALLICYGAEPLRYNTIPSHSRLPLTHFLPSPSLLTAGLTAGTKDVEGNLKLPDQSKDFWECSGASFQATSQNHSPAWIFLTFLHPWFKFNHSKTK